MVKAATVSLLLLVAINRFFLYDSPIPRSIFLLDWGVTIGMIGGVRAMVVRALRERNWQFLFDTKSKTRALIVGANDAGELLLRAIRCDNSLRYDVVGFISESVDTVGASIGGVLRSRHRRPSLHDRPSP